MSFLKCFIVFLIAGMLLQPAQGRTQGRDDIVFIVNSENPADEISVADIRDYYFKFKRRWPNGESVRFIDRSAPDIRETFLRKILHKSNSDVELFWIGQKLYTGNSAPLREASDRATIQFVSSFPGAIGYVTSEAASAAKNIKVISLDLNGD